MIKYTLMLLLTLLLSTACTKSKDSTESIDKQINNCIDQKLNDGWDTSRAESFCDNHYY
ncbi:MAG: hypothetical protein MK008_10295 [Bdellovibrionales bacterium]|nr:hypothetical protein [Bdellovibrionales bacterium]